MLAQRKKRVKEKTESKQKLCKRRKVHTILAFRYSYKTPMQSITENLEGLLGTKKIPSEKEKELFQKAQDFVEYIKWIP